MSERTKTPPMPEMEGLLMYGSLYVKETDCRRCVNWALKHGRQPAIEAFVSALTGDDDPQLWRLAWLESLLAEINAGRFGVIVRNEDPNATLEMLANVRELAKQARAALSAPTQPNSQGPEKER